MVNQQRKHNLPQGRVCWRTMFSFPPSEVVVLTFKQNSFSLIFGHFKGIISRVLPVRSFESVSCCQFRFALFFRRERVFAQSYKWTLNLQRCNGIISRNSIIQELQLLHVWAGTAHSFPPHLSTLGANQNFQTLTGEKRLLNIFLNLFHVWIIFPLSLS